MRLCWTIVVGIPLLNTNVQTEVHPSASEAHAALINLSAEGHGKAWCNTHLRAEKIPTAATKHVDSTKAAINRPCPHAQVIPLAMALARIIRRSRQCWPQPRQEERCEWNDVDAVCHKQALRSHHSQVPANGLAMSASPGQRDRAREPWRYHVSRSKACRFTTASSREAEIARN